MDNDSLAAGQEVAGLKQGSSERQLLANRANALKSTGPRTPEGKARSSRSALKHGLTASRFHKGDKDWAAFEKFRSGIVSSIKPQDFFEGLVVEQLVLALWGQSKGFEIDFDYQRAVMQETKNCFAAFEEPGISAAMERISRYRVQRGNEAHRLLALLLKMRHEKRAASGSEAQALSAA